MGFCFLDMLCYITGTKRGIVQMSYTTRGSLLSAVRRGDEILEREYQEKAMKQAFEELKFTFDPARAEQKLQHGIFHV